MLHQHATRVRAGERHREALHGRERGGEIAVQVGRAEHLLLRRDVRVLAPRLRLLVAAALHRHARLQLQPGVSHLALKVGAHHAGALAVAPLHEQVALLVAPHLVQDEHVPQVGVEALGQEVHLHRAEAVVEIDGGAHTLGVLLLQIRRELDDGGLATDGGDVQILVEGLRGAEAAGVREAQVDVLGRVEAEVRPRAEDDMIHQVVLIQAPADEEAPLIVLPLVLGEHAPDVHRLRDDAVVAQHLVPQVVVAIFRPAGERGGHEEALVPIVRVLRPADEGHVGRMPVGVGVVPGAVVAVALRVLRRGIDVQAVAVVFREKVELQPAAVYLVVGLLRDIGLVRRQVHQVTAPAELADVVVLEGELGVGARLQVRAEAECLRLQFA